MADFNFLRRALPDEQIMLFAHVAHDGIVKFVSRHFDASLR